MENPEEVELVVKCIDGNSLKFKSFVRDLKSKIEEKTRIPANHQRILYQGKVLRNDHRINFYNLTNGTVIHLVGYNHPPRQVPPNERPAQRNQGTQNFRTPQGGFFMQGVFPPQGQGGAPPGNFGQIFNQMLSQMGPIMMNQRNTPHQQQQQQRQQQQRRGQQRQRQAQQRQQRLQGQQRQQRLQGQQRQRTGVGRTQSPSVGGSPPPRPHRRSASEGRGAHMLISHDAVSINVNSLRGRLSNLDQSMQRVQANMGRMRELLEKYTSALEDDVNPSESPSNGLSRAERKELEKLQKKFSHDMNVLGLDVSASYPMVRNMVVHGNGRVSTSSPPSSQHAFTAPNRPVPPQREREQLPPVTLLDPNQRTRSQPPVQRAQRVASPNAPLVGENRPRVNGLVLHIHANYEDIESVPIRMRDLGTQLMFQRSNPAVTRDVITRGGQQQRLRRNRANQGNVSSEVPMTARTFVYDPRSHQMVPVVNTQRSAAARNRRRVSGQSQRSLNIQRRRNVQQQQQARAQQARAQQARAQQRGTRSSGRSSGAASRQRRQEQTGAGASRVSDGALDDILGNVLSELRNTSTSSQSQGGSSNSQQTESAPQPTPPPPQPSARSNPDDILSGVLGSLSRRQGPGSVTDQVGQALAPLSQLMNAMRGIVRNNNRNAEGEGGGNNQSLLQQLQGMNQQLGIVNTNDTPLDKFCNIIFDSMSMNDWMQAMYSGRYAEIVDKAMPRLRTYMSEEVLEKKGKSARQRAMVVEAFITEFRRRMEANEAFKRLVVERIKPTCSQTLKYICDIVRTYIGLIIEVTVDGVTPRVAQFVGPQIQDPNATPVSYEAYAFVELVTILFGEMVQFFFENSRSGLADAEAFIKVMASETLVGVPENLRSVLENFGGSVMARQLLKLYEEYKEKYPNRDLHPTEFTGIMTREMEEMIEEDDKKEQEMGGKEEEEDDDDEDEDEGEEDEGEYDEYEGEEDDEEDEGEEEEEGEEDDQDEEVPEGMEKITKEQWSEGLTTEEVRDVITTVERDCRIKPPKFSGFSDAYDFDKKKEKEDDVDVEEEEEEEESRDGEKYEADDESGDDGFYGSDDSELD